MNRQQRRNILKNPKAQEQYDKTLAKLAKQIIGDAFESTAGRLKEGDKVKLDVDYIKNSPAYRVGGNEKRNKFVDDNEGVVFTVIYDKRFTNNPSIVCLEEDTTDPRWLWTTKELLLISEEKRED